MAASTGTDAVDHVLEKLLAVRGERPGKQVALEDNEIRMLCVRARARPASAAYRRPLRLGAAAGVRFIRPRLF